VESCYGNHLIRIREGEMEGARLAGISFLVTFHMGRWTRIYLDESLDAPRQAAFDALLPVAFAGFTNLARTRERAPPVVEESVSGTNGFRSEMRASG